MNFTQWSTELKEVETMFTKGELCSCGNPQSHPIPHEHDWTEREKQIIWHYARLLSGKDEGISKLYDALKRLFEAIESLES